MKMNSEKEAVRKSLKIAFASLYFAKDNFPLCYDPTFPSLFLSLIPPLNGSPRERSM